MTFDIQDACVSTTINENSNLPTFMVNVAETESYDIDLFTDSASLSLGNMDGKSFCGPRVYQISSNNNFAFLTLTDSILTISPISPNDEGTF